MYVQLLRQSEQAEKPHTSMDGFRVSSFAKELWNRGLRTSGHSLIVLAQMCSKAGVTDILDLQGMNVQRAFPELGDRDCVAMQATTRLLISRSCVATKPEHL